MNGILIPFQPDMVRAICTCRKCGHLSIPFPCEKCGSEEFVKTQTRRVVKEQPTNSVRYDGIGLGDEDSETHYWEELGAHGHGIEKYIPIGKCPHGKPGAQLVVREKLIKCQDSEASIPMALYDVGRSPVIRDGKSAEWQWKVNTIPSRYMPRWAGRIPLLNCGVRVERVQDITEEDAIAEGVTVDPREGRFSCVITDSDGNAISEPHYLMPTCRSKFGNLWDSINGERGYSWESNPHVWVLTFKRV